MAKELITYTNGQLSLDVTVTPDTETVWLTQDQMSTLFDTARSTVAYHIGNIFKEGELDKDTSVEFFDRSDGRASRPPAYYNLDVIISVGYRVKSQRGVAFRKWANQVLKQYILKGYAVNENRVHQLGSVIRLMKRVEDDVDAKQVLSVIERYNTALDLLDDYDHQTLKRPEGTKGTYVITYEECRIIIDRIPSMIGSCFGRFGFIEANRVIAPLQSIRYLGFVIISAVGVQNLVISYWIFLVFTAIGTVMMVLIRIPEYDPETGDPVGIYG